MDPMCRRERMQMLGRALLGAGIFVAIVGLLCVYKWKQVVVFLFMVRIGLLILSAGAILMIPFLSEEVKAEMRSEEQYGEVL